MDHQPTRTQHSTEYVALGALDTAWALRPTDAAHVLRLADAIKTCPPILVRRDGLVLLDGHHRVQAALLRGKKRLPVEWFEGSCAEAYAAAVAANSRHGLPLDAAARRTAVQTLLDAAPDWSNRKVAAVAGVSEATVRRARRAGASMTQPGCVIGIDGRRYPLPKQAHTAAADARRAADGGRDAPQATSVAPPAGDATAAAPTEARRDTGTGHAAERQTYPGARTPSAMPRDREVDRRGDTGHGAAGSRPAPGRSWWRRIARWVSRLLRRRTILADRSE